jgi:hypothetical protein
MPLDPVKFRFRHTDADRESASGPIYHFITNRMINEDQLERLRAFWAERPELADGQVITV